MTELLLHPPVRQQGTDAAVQGLPLLTVINDDDPSDGRLYLASIGAGGTQTLPYLMILDKQASVLFSRQPGFGPVYDFVAHPNNTYSFFNAPTATYYILDSQYTRFDTLSAANGYQTDPHELRFHSDGSYDLIAVDPIPMDLRTIVEGGDSNAIVMDNLIQEFDKDGNLIFEWRALDHFKITDIQHEQNTGPMPVDFCHMNGIDLDNDGNLLLTSRHLDEITKIDRATGSIIWRFGGKNNQFTVSGDSVGFSHQHSIRSTPLGTYLLFDNGDYHNSGGVFSRAVEYTLDTVAKTAKQIWEFRHDPPIFTFAMGSVQRLDNGNTLIGWGQNRGIAVTEVGPFNRTVFELTMDSAVCSYRAYKFPDGYVHSGSLGTSLQPAMTTGTRIECTPNPVHDHAQIQFTSTVDGPVNIALYDGLGRKLCSVFEGTVSAGEHSNPLNMQGLAAGTYFVRIVSATGAPVSAPVLLTR